MKNTNKKLLTALVILSLVLVVCAFYFTTYTAYRDVYMNPLEEFSPGVVGKTVDVDGVMATIKGPKTVNLNDNVTFTYTVTSKRSDTVFLEEIPGHPPIVLGSLKSGETKTFTETIRMRDTDEGIGGRYEGDEQPNSILRGFYLCNVGGDMLTFNNANEECVGCGYFDVLRYENWQCALNPNIYLWQYYGLKIFT